MNSHTHAAHEASVVNRRASRSRLAALFRVDHRDDLPGPDGTALNVFNANLRPSTCVAVYDPSKHDRRLGTQLVVRLRRQRSRRDVRPREYDQKRQQTPH